MKVKIKQKNILKNKKSVKKKTEGQFRYFEIQRRENPENRSTRK